jgi:hypothetical protein
MTDRYPIQRLFNICITPLLLCFLSTVAAGDQQPKLYPDFRDCMRQASANGDVYKQNQCVRAKKAFQLCVRDHEGAGRKKKIANCRKAEAENPTP